MTSSTAEKTGYKLCSIMQPYLSLTLALPDLTLIIFEIEAAHPSGMSSSMVLYSVSVRGNLRGSKGMISSWMESMTTGVVQRDDWVSSDGFRSLDLVAEEVRRRCLKRIGSA